MNNDARIKRLRFRSLHRGNKEMDIVFSRFIEAGFDALDAKSLDIFEALLEENDVDLWDWVVGKCAAPAKYTQLIEVLKNPRHCEEATPTKQSSK